MIFYGSKNLTRLLKNNVTIVEIKFDDGFNLFNCLAYFSIRHDTNRTKLT